MNSLRKKDSIFAWGVYLALTAIAFLSNFKFDTFRWTTLFFYGIVGIGVLIFIKVFSDKKTANIAVGSALAACACFNFFHTVLMDAVGIEDRIKSLAALLLVLVSVILLYAKKLIFTAPIPVALLFLNERLAAAAAVMLLCCALISLAGSNKKSIGIILSVWFAAVTAAVYIYVFLYSQTYFNYANNIIAILNDNRNCLALAVAEIILIVLAYKNQCNTKVILTVSYGIIFALTIVGCIHFKFGFLSYGFFAAVAAVLCAMLHDKKLYQSAADFVKNNKAVSIVIFLLMLT